MRQWYTPYGAVRASSGTLPTKRTYTGQLADETGLYFYNARYYAPLGRFISPDPLVPEPGNPQALNRYAYGKNNPIRYNDPSGHCAGLLALVCFAILMTPADDMTAILLISSVTFVGVDVLHQLDPQRTDATTVQATQFVMGALYFGAEGFANAHLSLGIARSNVNLTRHAASPELSDNTFRLSSRGSAKLTRPTTYITEINDEAVWSDGSLLLNKGGMRFNNSSARVYGNVEGLPETGVDLRATNSQVTVTGHVLGNGGGVRMTTTGSTIIGGDVVGRNYYTTNPALTRLGMAGKEELKIWDSSVGGQVIRKR